MTNRFSAGLIVFAGIGLFSGFLFAQGSLTFQDRFKVDVTWQTADMAAPLPAHGGFLEDNLAYFHFFSPNNVELVVKVLNACSTNNRFWVFAAGLTNVEVTLTVTDLQSETSKQYLNPLASKPFRPITDTAAFATCPAPVAAQPSAPSPPATEKTLGLQNNRFDVTLSWEDPQGQQRDGTANVFTQTSGGFRLNGPNSPLETFVKILDGREENGSFWVYLTSFSNAAMTVTVTDTQTQTTREYHNKAGSPLNLIDHQFSKQDTHRWIYPWISNSATFGSRLIANNFSSNEIAISLVAIRADGTNQTVERTIPGGGFLNERAESLFGGLGQGPGYAVILTAPESSLAARWVTENLGTGSGGSPSQGVAIKYAGGEQQEGTRNGRVGKALMFGYLPQGADTVAAPVIVNVGSRNSNVMLYFFDSAGILLGVKEVANLIPQRPFAAVLSDLLPGMEGDVAMVAHSDGEPLTGVVFTFNGLLEPSLGNAEAIPFAPPGATLQ